MSETENLIQPVTDQPADEPSTPEAPTPEQLAQSELTRVEGLLVNSQQAAAEAEAKVADIKANPANYSVEQIMEIASAATAAKADVAANEKLVTNAKRVVRQGDVNQLTRDATEAFRQVEALLDIDRAKSLEVDGYDLKVRFGETGLVIEDLKAIGPGVVAAVVAKPAKAADGKTTRAPRATAGVNWSKIALENNLDPKGASAHLVVAKRLPELHASIPHECGLNK